MLRFIESQHDFKDGLKIIFELGLTDWILIILILLGMVFTTYMTVQSIRFRDTALKIGLFFGISLAFFTVLLIKPISVLTSDIGHYEGNMKVGKVDKGKDIYKLSSESSEVRSKYNIYVSKTQFEKDPIKKGDKVYLKTKPVEKVMTNPVEFNTTNDNIEFKKVK